MTDGPELRHDAGSDGEELLRTLMALASRHRLRIIAMLRGRGRQYVSQLARDIGISRPLLHMHLQRLEAAGLVRGELELGADGKAVKYFEVTDFALTITPDVIERAVRTLRPEPEAKEKEVE